MHLGFITRLSVSGFPFLLQMASDQSTRKGPYALGLVSTIMTWRSQAKMWRAYSVHTLENKEKKWKNNKNKQHSCWWSNRGTEIKKEKTSEQK